VQSHIERIIRPIEFGTSPSLKVHIEVSGILNSLVFIEDYLIKNLLGAEEV
jgi:hypothetical protein